MIDGSPRTGTKRRGGRTPLPGANTAPDANAPMVPTLFATVMLFAVVGNGGESGVHAEGVR